MGDNTAQSSVGPIGPKLGDLPIDPTVTAALGGLNPYSEHYQVIGAKYLGYIKDQTRLKPHHRVLEIGCGTGRMANALAGYLDDSGSYHGFDVNERFVGLCTETIKRQNFTFETLDIKHDEYNENGTLDPATFAFPYPDKSFDVVIAVAVFNHFLLPWTLRYLDEVSRVLRHKGSLFATCILLNGVSIPRISGRTEHPWFFEVKTEVEWHEFTARPLWNVALPERPIRRALLKNGLMIKEPIRYGHWCESPNALDGHDILTAIKVH